MVAAEPRDMRRCLDVVRFLSMAIAERVIRTLWSSGHLAEIFHRAPQALPTIASEGDLQNRFNQVRLASPKIYSNNFSTLLPCMLCLDILLNKLVVNK